MAGRGAYQKKAQNIQNVRARHEFLLAGIQAPGTVDKAARDALTGQRAFAALDLPRLKITPIALNTIKSLSDEIFTDQDNQGRKGFEYLNALRVRLHEAMAGVLAARTRVAKGERTENRIEQLAERLTALEAQSIKRQRAYLSLYAALNGLIKDKHLPVEAQHRLYRLLENHHAAFAELFESNAPDLGVAQLLSELNKPE